MRTVSSKSQVVVPAAMHLRLGLGSGARVEIFEEADGLGLRVVRIVADTDVRSLAGMVVAPLRDDARSLNDFDPASLAARTAGEGR